MVGTERLIISGGKMNHRFFKQALELSGKERPNILIDCLGSTTPSTFETGAKLAQMLQSAFGVRGEQLQESYGKPPSPEQAQSRVAAADILCVSGGSTLRLSKQWQKLDITELITERVQQGTLVGSGGSAGALIWFNKCHSDSAQYEVREGERWLYGNLAGIGVLRGWATVHYGDSDNLGRDRGQSFRDTLWYGDGLWHNALALETNAAIICHDGIAEVLQLESTNADIYEFHGITRDLAYRKRAGEQLGSLSVVSS